MKTIVTPDAMRALERRDIINLGIPSVVLMDRAARAVAHRVRRYLHSGAAAVLCGPGNNGGDGYWAALHLLRMGAQVRVFSLSPVRGDGLIAFEALRSLGVPVQTRAEALSDYDVIVDALFGTGFHGALCGVYLETVRQINDSGVPVVAVDIPSGVSGADGRISSQAVRATETVTFAHAKAGHLLFPGRMHTGTLTVADIGLGQAQSDLFQIEPKDLYRRFLSPRPADAHKGTFGHVGLLAGSRGMAGAAVLAALGALKAGAGLVSVACAEHGVLPIVQQEAFEAMAWPLREDAFGGVSADNDLSAFFSGKAALGVGCGLGKGPGAAAMVRAATSCDLPLVLDADGLNVCQGVFGSNTVITPHPGEMARLTSTTVAQVIDDPLAAAVAFAAENQVVTLLKGATTVVADPTGAVCLVAEGSPALSTGGSGDVLTGVIAALLARGLSPFDAACAGACLHAMAGRIAGERFGEESVRARQIAQCLGDAFRDARRASGV